MNKSSAFAWQLGRLGAGIFGAIAAATLVSMGTCFVRTVSVAQLPGQSAPSATAAAMIDRASRFLNDVAKLSPMPDGTDLDRAQKWPRQSYREIDFRDGRGWQRLPRSTGSRVSGHAYSGQPRVGLAWTVRLCGEELELSIDPTSNAVVSFHDRILGERLVFDSAPEPSKCISSEIALSRATAYLRAAGMNEEGLFVRSVQWEDLSGVKCAESRRWRVSWNRVWQGVPFHDQMVSMVLDAGWGRLMNFGSALGLPAPTSAALNILPPSATDRARAFLDARSHSLMGDPAVELKIVQPTSYWRDGKQNPELGIGTRLAWIVRGVDGEASKGMLADVWVDAGTGDVVGGELYVLKGRSVGASRGKILQRLSLATRLELRDIARPNEPRRMLEAKAAPLRFYGSLSGCLPHLPGAKPAKAAATHTMTVTGPGGIETRYDYDETTGLITDEEGNAVLASHALRQALIPRATLISHDK